MKLNVEIFLIISLLTSINCEIFSAIEELEKLAAVEQIIIKELQSFATQLNDDYVNRWESSFSNGEKKVS